ncbi:Nbl1/Borealin N-terminal domain-containing protein [Chloropicon primus]|uniref:Uncharacterized protein n=1 Tax=Chloropicon primus TaxID=1764295 RepID=A0A5B8MM83_9CHLO|nr:hypothetical protein A3770_04p29280 [Chloropicon primus]UPQ99619.1 Nbl1/Borealin N-terminal domain-containing protein [Chloropicon primus]|eukprot:QDZ20410.1 hypothetical protein A3770_04p29280 [Chloropicon primus]
MEEIRRDVESKCAALEAFCDEAALALRSELKIQLLKLPKKVRNMPLKEFLSKFAGDINKVILDELNARWITSEGGDLSALENSSAAVGQRTTLRRGTRRRAAPATVMATRTTRKRAREAAASEVVEDARIPATEARATRARTRASSMQMQTPAVSRTQASRVPFTPVVTNSLPPDLALPANTVLRNPKRGEVFFSKNGSPLGMCAEADEGEYEGEGYENENSLVTPMAKQWKAAAKSAIKTSATVRCTRRTRQSKNASSSVGGLDQLEEGDETPLSPEDLQILLTNEEGEEIKLDNENIESSDLPVDIKSMALGKLMGLQNKVMSMIASLGQQ